MGGFKERLRKLDSHSSVSKEFRVYTIHGAALSIVTCFGACLTLCHVVIVPYNIGTFHSL